ncbi:hypothetical protein HOH87_04720 [bacterium]|jgi:hypothetical protein|nr:hypothetical protein [bacterium]
MSPQSNIIKIVGIPIGGKETASTRLRYYSFLEGLPKDQFAWVTFSGVSDFKDCSLVYVQKQAIPALLPLLKKLQAMEIGVIYDIDDDIEMLENVIPTFAGIDFIQLADAVTVATKKSVSILKSSTQKPIHIVPNGIDYYDQIEKYGVPSIQPTVTAIGSFGNLENCTEAHSKLSILSNTSKSIFITHPDDSFPGHIVPWHLETFIQDLRQLDVCLLTQPDNERGHLKSNNRLLVTLAAGIPTIAFDSPSFSETLEEAGLQALIVSCDKELQSTYSRLQDCETRRDIQLKGLDYIDAHYTPIQNTSSIASVFKSVVRTKKETTSRTTVLNALAKKFNYTRYLEVGVRDGTNLSLIKIPHKDGVDPAGNCNYPMTSDAFFKSISSDPSHEKYDLIFLDGLHLDDQVRKDIRNALLWLKPGGTIVLHDCNPPSELHQVEERVNDLGVPEDQLAWNGTVWKSFVHYRSTRDDLEMFTIDTDYGLGVIRKGDQALFSLPKTLAMDYSLFDQHRVEALNLIQPHQFIDWLDQQKK